MVSSHASLRPFLRPQPWTRLPTQRFTPQRTFLTSSPLRSSGSSPSSPSPSEPALLPRFKADLKASMRSKDKPRLDTLRSLLAAITNASKTSKPIATDKDMLSLLQSHIKASVESVENFERANRPELVAKERAQLHVLREYEALIEVVGADEVERIVAEVRQESREKGVAPNAGKFTGLVMQRLGGRPVDMKAVKRKVDEVCAS